MGEGSGGEVSEREGTGGISRASVGGVSNDFTLHEVGSFFKVLSREMTQFILLFFIAPKKPEFLKPIVILCSTKRK